MLLTRKTTIFTVLALLAIILGAGVAHPGLQIWAVDRGNQPDMARGPKTLDDLFAKVAGHLPGFGGMFLDGDKLNVYLTNPGQKAAAERAVGAVFGRA